MTHFKFCYELRIKEQNKAKEWETRKGLLRKYTIDHDWALVCSQAHEAWHVLNQQKRCRFQYQKPSSHSREESEREKEEAKDWVFGCFSQIFNLFLSFLESLFLSLNLYLIDWYYNSDLFILISMVSEREAKSNVWNKEFFFFEKRNKEMYMCVCIYIYIYICGTVATISPIQRSNRAANNIHKVGIFDSWRRRWWWWLVNEYLRALLWTSQMYFDDFLNFRI